GSAASSPTLGIPPRRKLEPSPHHQPHHQRQHPRRNIVQNDPCPLRQLLQPTDRPRLPDIEHAEQNQRQHRMPPIRPHGNQCKPLPRHFVDHHKPRILAPSLPRHNRRRRNPHQ